MKTLSIAVAALAAVALAVYVKTSDPSAALLAGFALVCAYTTFRSAAISTFLKIFIGIFATETVAFGLVWLAGNAGYWPAGFDEYQLPPSLPLTVAMFAILTWASSHIPVVRSISNISDHYFASIGRTVSRVWPFPSFQCGESALAKAMVVALVLINQTQVVIEVRLSFWSRDFFTALQSKDVSTFWRLLLTVLPFWLVILIVFALVEIVVQAMLTIRWRRYLTGYYLSRWLDGSTHYRMSLRGDGTDNPDQRISEDVNRFIDGGAFGGGNNSGYGVYSFSILLISTLSSLVSFAIILWGISESFTIPGLGVPVPGSLFWAALIYAIFGTVVTHWIGRRLAGLQFAHQRYEADFRFSLARVREYSEQVALLKGEAAERHKAMGRFARIFDNFIEITHVRKKINAFVIFYSQISSYIPIIVAAPFYFVGTIQYGVLNQTSLAFRTVESALKFFVNYYGSIAEFKAVLDRLTGFDKSIDAAKNIQANPPIAIAPAMNGAISASHLSLGLPEGRVILGDSSFEIPAHQATLVSGPSGSGKSTLFRAVAGLWPTGSGAVNVPLGARVMLLPQKPYIPIGSLRAAVAYPADETAYSDDTIRSALEAARLPALANRLNEEDNWSMRLSGGEQQRLAVARALLAKPDWLFLDEATAALDEESEAALYKAFAEKLPDATIVSIGHRSTLNAFHKRRIELTPKAAGVFAARNAEMVG
jgi:putative ATP-binding cassette transporter